MNFQFPEEVRRVGFVATRIAGTDGVSLETKKWAAVFESMGLDCFYIAGELDLPTERCTTIPEAHFQHPEIQAIQQKAFGTRERAPELTIAIRTLADHLLQKLQAAISAFDIDMVVAENSLTIPMNIPLGVALVRLIQETGLPCIAHHHDFFWERPRFLINCVDDFLRAAFPPPLPQIEHVVINSLAAQEFCRRIGLCCRIIPNVMDFAHPPAPLDDYAKTFRREVGLSDDDILVLQPTRVVARKGIEHSIELVRWLDDPRAKLVITHAAGDEGDSYARRVRRYAELLKVPVIFANRWISDRRGTLPDGTRQFTIWDVFPQADLVTYPSTYEGFGNAFLEAVYFKRPILCNRYTIFQTDIQPCGFETILFDGYLTDETVQHVRRVLHDPQYRHRMVEHNYCVGRRFFSYEIVAHELKSILLRPSHVCHCRLHECPEPPGQ